MEAPRNYNRAGKMVMVNTVVEDGLMVKLDVIEI